MVKLIEFGFAREKYGGFISEEATTYLLKTSSSQYLLNRMGDFIFYVFAFIGFLYFLAKKDKYNTSLAIAGLLMVGFAGLGLIFKIRNFETRFLLASQFVLIISAIYGIIYLVYVFKSKRVKIILLTLIVTGTFFFMITSSMSNFDSPIYTENQIRMAFTQSEIQSMDTILKNHSKIITSDQHTSAYFLFKNNYYLDTEKIKFRHVDGYIIQNDFHNSTGLILIREYIIHNPFNTVSGPIKIDYDPQQQLDKEKFSRIYDCGSVHGFLKS